jgi:lysylphosphatidylglycerol synthetase-like protein (DUF2156 family)
MASIQQEGIMSALVMRVSWNTDHEVWLRACLWCALLLAVTMVTPLIVTAATPVVVGCCTSTLAALPELAVGLGLLVAMWSMKP